MELRNFTSIDEALLREIGRLRVEALETETSKASAIKSWIDEFDRTARHWVVFREEVPVAAARLSIHENLSEVPDAESYAGVFPQPPEGPIASFNRLVVHPSARGAGLSKRLDFVGLDASEEIGCHSVVLSTASGPKRVKQLIGWGFELAGYGPRFQKPPLSFLPPPAVLLCRLPRITTGTGIEPVVTLKPA